MEHYLGEVVEVLQAKELFQEELMKHVYPLG